MLSFYETNSHYPFKDPRKEADAVFLVKKTYKLPKHITKIF